MQHEKELLYIHIAQLVARRLKGELSPSEQAELEEILNVSEANRKVYDELVDEESRKIVMGELERFDGNVAFDRFLQRTGQSKHHNRHIIKVWGPAIAAAAIFLTIAITAHFYFKPDQQNIKPLTLVQDVAPGGNRATLRLSTGRVITLADQKTGMTITEGGITITKNADGQLVYSADKETEGTGEGYNTVSTPLGGQYQVTLPDGTKVWLNAASTLSYAPSLKMRGDDKRRVSLTGEAYFEVAKDGQRPFIVATRGQEVEVLGTQFNINSYADEAVIRTTLLEGSVRIHQSNSNLADQVLKPGQEAELGAGCIRVSEADTESVTGWRNGLFVFNNADVPTVMRQLSRWYDVEVEYNGGIPKDLFTGGISRGSNLSAVLKMLELIKIRTKLVQTGRGKKLIINP